MVTMEGGARTTSLRNNLFTFSRDADNGPGSVQVKGGASSYAYADYNAFYSPDNSNKTRYDFSGAGVHDAAAGADLSSSPFAGARVTVGDLGGGTADIDE